MENILRAKVFHYEIIEIKSLDYLEKFKDHKRLRTFFYKGTTCVNCGLKGTILAKGIKKYRSGQCSYHWDIYTDDFYPLTVDHIIPKSKNGSDDLINQQPMCYKCNSEKGDTYIN